MSSAPDDVSSAGEDARLPPGLPGRGAYLLAFGSVVVSGLLGATIGWGLVDVSCERDCGLAVAAGALVGAAVAAVGVGVIAVLVLRAMSEWRYRQTEPPGPGHAPKSRRRNPSA